MNARQPNGPPAGALDLPALRDRAAIWALATGSFISQTGNSITALAIPWFVLITTGSAARTGLATAIIALSPIVAGLLGGPIVDRLGFKRSSVVSDALSGVTVLLVPILYLLDVLAYWQLVTLIFFGAFFDIPGWTARNAMVVGLARKARMSLTQANSIMQLSFRLSDAVVAPLLAGTLIAAVGAANVLFFDAATFAASMLIIGLLIPATAVRASDGREPEEDEPDGGIVDELLTGFRFFLQDTALRTILPTALLFNFVSRGITGVLLLVYVEESFGEPKYLGFIFAALGIGTLVGTLLFGLYGDRLSRYSVFLFSFASGSVALWLFVMTSNLPINLVAMFLLGTTIGPLNPLLYTILQARTPERILGRVTSALVTLFTLAAPLGALAAGLFADWTSVSATLMSSAGLVTLIPLWLGLNPRSRAAAPAFEG